MSEQTGASAGSSFSAHCASLSGHEALLPLPSGQRIHAQPHSQLQHRESHKHTPSGGANEVHLTLAPVVSHTRRPSWFEESVACDNCHMSAGILLVLVLCMEACFSHRKKNILKDY